MHYRMTRRALMAGSMLAAMPALAAQVAAMPYRDPALPVADRVRDLLARMTLEEKVAQMRCLWFGKASICNAEGDFAPDKAASVIADGIGQIGRPSDTAGSARFKTQHYRSLDETIAFVNAVQRFLVENTRLGIPALFHEETAHGLAVPGATVFPSRPRVRTPRQQRAQPPAGRRTEMTTTSLRPAAIASRSMVGPMTISSRAAASRWG
ncbi:hypothetical protein DM806_22480 [Sphingobium lactosutens]|uniref:glycoside hydrolase family 3 N-terminal domain-containing protein n=1 Tax=Sphingobium lactosutens TaxID=522773 RepID=UPI0015BF635F|nr:glycoside hydrolase family 3 N-terminal domain-containing protein [Sphingobium lactosutens]NWK98385.1 hypothetical protein [Sphingobium lactosutens]